MDYLLAVIGRHACELAHAVGFDSFFREQCASGMIIDLMLHGTGAPPDYVAVGKDVAMFIGFAIVAYAFVGRARAAPKA